MSHDKTPLKMGVRAAISVAVVWHLWAVIAPPLGFQTRGPLGSSPSVATFAGPVRGYGEMLYLNRGYAFFAPDPGPSHLVQASYLDANGNRVQEIFPDRKRQWPRLMYHRHFMLTEFLHEIYQPPGPPVELAKADPEAARQWATLRGRYENVRKSFTDHLSNLTPGGKEFAIRRLEHRIPSFIEIIAEPIPLDDRRLYGVLVDRRVDVDSSGGPQTVNTEVLPTLGTPEVDLVEREARSTQATESEADTKRVDAVSQPLPNEAKQPSDQAADDSSGPPTTEAVLE
jgi:hypothetical protein